jgi:hypothetical protein
MNIRLYLQIRRLWVPNLFSRKNSTYANTDTAWHAAPCAAVHEALVHILLDAFDSFRAFLLSC